MDNNSYEKLADEDTVKRTVSGLESRGYKVTLVNTGKEALAAIKNLIPDGASVMNGSSVTLEQIGYVDYLKSGEHKWKNLHAEVALETDPVKRLVLRKQALASDFYLGSVHGLSEEGEFVVGSNTGSQLGHIVFSSQNLIMVASTKKIVKNLDAAIKRLREYVTDLEKVHLREKYGFETALNKMVVFWGESPRSTRKINFILVQENLGY